MYNINIVMIIKNVEICDVIDNIVCILLFNYEGDAYIMKIKDYKANT